MDIIEQGITGQGNAVPRRLIWRRLAWFAAIWAASVAVMACVAGVLRMWLT